MTPRSSRQTISPGRAGHRDAVTHPAAHRQDEGHESHRDSGALLPVLRFQAIVSFTRALSNSLVERGIRVNAVAPGPIWTPLIPSTFTPEEVEKFGQNTPMGRVGQPNEVASSFVFLASDDASYMTGQVLHPNGGTVVGG